LIEVNAKRLKEYQANEWHLLLEGRCDEVGSVDYNLVLGERRAQTVKRYLEELGITSAQVQILSYGKEKPLCIEHSEECWKMNRSVRFVLQ
jgi:peptidoglycan-associated lipoprotein